MQTVLTVPDDNTGERLDQFVVSMLGGMSRSQVQRLIKNGHIHVAGLDAKSNQPVKAGQEITVDTPEPTEATPQPEALPLPILYQDADVIVIDKPAGLPMHTTAKFWRNTLTALLRERYPGQPMDVAHRIDRETSGVLLIARGRSAASFLTRAFARREVDKTYLALVKGHPPDSGRIDRPLRLLDTKSRIMMGPAPEGDIGGLPAIADQLADDYRLGELTRERGLRTVLSEVVVETVVEERSLLDLLGHELRWLRTIKAVRPLGYSLAFVTFALPVALIGAALAGGARLGLLALAVTALLRLLMHGYWSPAGERSTWMRLWAVPLHDCTLFAVWCWGFVGQRVNWGHSRLRLAQDGSVSRLATPIENE